MQCTKFWYSIKFPMNLNKGITVNYIIILPPVYINTFFHDNILQCMFSETILENRTFQVKFIQNLSTYE